MTNRYRGEISAELGGRRFDLCLTLGALAELESAFAVKDLVSLARRFEEGQLSARDLLKIIACGLRGGGTSISDEEVAMLGVADGLQGYVSIAGELLAVTFGALDAGQSANPRKPQAT
jgi:hypothetical protein